MGAPDYSVTLQVLRMLRLLERTRRRAMSLRELARELEVHPRTIKRWVDALHEALDNDEGEPLVRRELREGQAWIAMPRSGAGLSATVFQYASAWAAVTHLAGPHGSLLSDAARDLVDRAEEALPDRLRHLVDRVPTAFCTVPFAPKDYRAHEDTLDTVISAVLRQRRLRLEYVNLAGRASKLQVEPYTLVMYRESLYLLGRPVGGKRLLTFAIDRIQQVEERRDKTFELPSDFSPSEAFANSLGLWRTDDPPQRVRLRFAASVVDAIAERRWTGFAGLERSPNGSAILSLDLPTTPELKTWLLGWGASVQVLAPDGLRASIREELDAAAALYLTSGVPDGGSGPANPRSRR